MNFNEDQFIRNKKPEEIDWFLVLNFYTPHEDVFREYKDYIFSWGIKNIEDFNYNIKKYNNNFRIEIFEQFKNFAMNNFVPKEK